MKLTIEKDNGETEVFQNISDLYIAYRTTSRLMATHAGDVISETRSASHSWGSNIRELVKELHQSLIELQDFLQVQRKKENGSSF